MSNDILLCMWCLRQILHHCTAVLLYNVCTHTHRRRALFVWFSQPKLHQSMASNVLCLSGGKPLRRNNFYVWWLWQILTSLQKRKLWADEKWSCFYIAYIKQNLCLCCKQYYLALLIYQDFNKGNILTKQNQDNLMNLLWWESVPPYWGNSHHTPVYAKYGWETDGPPLSGKTDWQALRYRPLR